MISNQKMLFVCGAPRSGTTAMQALLTADTRIVMGMERYGSYLNGEFGPHLFAKERFFNFESDPRDLNRSRTYYKDVAEPHFDAATYIGDKIPLLYLEFDLVTKVYPDAKFVVLLRNIVDICNSYQNRKNDPQDNWSLDIDDAVSHWNRLLDFIKLHRADPRIKLMIYEDFYTNIDHYEDLYRFLGLTLDDVLKQQYQSLLGKTERLGQRRQTVLSDEQKLSIYKKANFPLYQSILNYEIPSSVSAEPRVKPVVKSRDPMSLDESDLIAAFRIFLGKTDATKAELETFASLNGHQVLSKIFASSEFQSNEFNRELISSWAKQIRDQLIKAKSSGGG